jgi:hypothetical protein
LTRLHSARFAAAFFVGFALACGEDATFVGNAIDTPGAPPAAPVTAGQSSAPDGPAAGVAPLYALSTLIFDDSGATAYVAMLDSLDQRDVDLSSAREFAGWSSIAAFDGALFVGGGESPELTRHPVADDGTLLDGERLSFANLGLSSVSFAYNAFLDATTAHMRLEETSRVLWDPVSLTIRGTGDAPEIPLQRDGLAVSAANDEGIAVRDDALFWPYFWHDADWYQFHQQSQIAVYEKDGSIRKIIDVPCPALNIATADEEGNLYFSGMVDTLAVQLLEQGSSLERCTVRIDAGQDSIADGWPRRFEELTEGRPAGRFYYLRDGVGVLSVFHGERATLDPNDSFGSIFADHWGMWLVDLDRWTAAPIDEWGFGSSNVFFSRVDGRTFLHEVASDFSQTVIYEITPSGSITPQITAPGYATVLVKVR